MAHRAIGPGSLVASRFRLEDLLEEHSGAWFWRATDLTLVRSVAVHVIARDDPRAAAVLTAARTSATVSDPRILRVLDAVEEEDLVHVVHEWGSGVSLDRLLAGELLEPRRAAWVAREVAEAIAVAHRQGIAHGRLIPENVLLTDAGSVKLIGFVVDAVLHGRAQPAGTVGAPPSEHESDVLNLGALLYACMTGKWAGFPASSLPEAPQDHERVCRPRQVRPGVPKQLDLLCDQILNPPVRGGRRYETAAEVCSALGDYLGDTLLNAPVDMAEATTFLDPAALEAAGTGRSSGGAGGPALDETQPGLPVLDPGRAPSPAEPARSAASSAAAPSTARPPVKPPLPPARAAAPASRTPERNGTTRGSDPEPARKPGSVSLRVAAVLGLLALVLVAVLLWPLLGGSDDTGEEERDGPRRNRDGAAPSVVLEPAAFDDFDPDGGEVPEENSDLVPLAFDGKPATAWETYTYFDGPALAPYRSGVGLLVDLGEEAEVGQVEVTLVGGPYDLELLAAPEGAARPTTTEGLETVEARSGVSGEIALRGAEAVQTRYVVVWLTALPRATDGYQGAVAEVVVRS